MFEFNTLAIGAATADRRDVSPGPEAVSFLLPVGTPKSEPNLKSSYIFPVSNGNQSVSQLAPSPSEGRPVPKVP